MNWSEMLLEFLPLHSFFFWYIQNIFLKNEESSIVAIVIALLSLDTRTKKSARVCGVNQSTFVVINMTLFANVLQSTIKKTM